MRKPTRRILLGGIAIGKGAPVTVQSMCSTDTSTCTPPSRSCGSRRPAARSAGRGPGQGRSSVLPAIKAASTSPWWRTSTFDYVTWHSPPSRPGSTGCGSTRATCADARVEGGRGGGRGRPGRPASRSASGSMPGRWNRSCGRSTATRPPRPWSSRRCGM